MKTGKKVVFACPGCRQQLIQVDSAYKCNHCGKEYPVKEGVICFLDEPDDFYEEAYKADKALSNITFESPRSLKAILYFYLYKDPYPNAIRKYARPSSIILDIGCAGGTKYLTQKGDVVGLDLSFHSLRATTKVYGYAVQADALKLPFPDGTFDLITSSYMFEHFVPSDKMPLLREMRRVLKPGGRIILQFDCDNNNPLFKWLKKDAELYRRQVVEIDHHYGLQMPSENLSLIKEAGFSVVKYRALNKTLLQYLAVYSWIAPYVHRSMMAAFAHRMGTLLNKSKLAWAPYNMLINWFDTMIEGFLPLDHARVLLVVAEKPVLR